MLQWARIFFMLSRATAWSKKTRYGSPSSAERAVGAASPVTPAVPPSASTVTIMLPGLWPGVSRMRTPRSISSPSLTSCSFMRSRMSAGVGGRGPVVGSRVAGVLALGGAHEHLGVREEVDVQRVVPVRVGEHDEVDIAWRQAALAQLLQQQRAAADVADVDQDRLRRANQGDAAERRAALVGLDAVALQDEVDRRARWLPPSLRDGRSRR